MHLTQNMKDALNVDIKEVIDDYFYNSFYHYFDTYNIESHKIENNIINNIYESKKSYITYRLITELINRNFIAKIINQNMLFSKTRSIFSYYRTSSRVENYIVDLFKFNFLIDIINYDTTDKFDDMIKNAYYILKNFYTNVFVDNIFKKIFGNDALSYNQYTLRYRENIDDDDSLVSNYLIDELSEFKCQPFSNLNFHIQFSKNVYFAINFIIFPFINKVCVIYKKLSYVKVTTINRDLNEIEIYEVIKRNFTSVDDLCVIVKELLYIVANKILEDNKHIIQLKSIDNSIIKCSNTIGFGNLYNNIIFQINCANNMYYACMLNNNRKLSLSWIKNAYSLKKRVYNIGTDKPFMEYTHDKIKLTANLYSDTLAMNLHMLRLINKQIYSNLNLYFNNMSEQFVKDHYDNIKAIVRKYFNIDNVSDKKIKALIPKLRYLYIRYNHNNRLIKIRTKLSVNNGTIYSKAGIVKLNIYLNDKIGQFKILRNYKQYWRIYNNLLKILNIDRNKDSFKRCYNMYKECLLLFINYMTIDKHNDYSNMISMVIDTYNDVCNNNNVYKSKYNKIRNQLTAIKEYDKRSSREKVNKYFNYANIGLNSDIPMFITKLNYYNIEPYFVLTELNIK